MNWKFTLIGLLIVLSILWIHPTHNMVKIVGVSGKVSYKLLPHDIISMINGKKITSEKEFYSVWDSINNTASIEVKREGLPYYYVSYNYKIVKDNNSVIFAENTGTSYIRFSYEFVTHNVFQLTNTTNVIKRLNKFGVSDAKIIGNKLHTRFSSGLVIDALGYKGEIVGKIGNKTVFTNANIKSYCESPSGCIYGIRQRPVNDTYQFFFQEQINLDKNAVNNIRNAIQNLPIGECTGGTCYLNDTIKVYLDGNKIGEILLPADYKEGLNKRLIVYGNTYPEVTTTKYEFDKFIGALATEINTNVTYLGTSPAYENPWIYIGIALVIPLLFGLIEFIKFKDKRYLISNLITSAEIFITLGVIALFGVIVNKTMLYGLIFWSIFYPALYLYYTLQAKGVKSKEYSMKNLDFKIHIALIFVSFVLIIWQPVAIIPLIVSSLKLFLTRGEFFKLNQ